jgi:hypothetical protein
LVIGRAGTSKTRRLITLISVGWLPPSLPPSGACLKRGTSGPVGLRTPPRVTPHRGCVSADRRWKPCKRLRQAAAIFLRSVTRQPAWPWPTGRHARLGPWRRRLAWPVCLWPCAGDPVDRAGPGPARCGLGGLWGALPDAVAGDDGPWPDTERPRPLRRGHDGPGSGRSWSCCPADGAPHWTSLRV